MTEDSTEDQKSPRCLMKSLKDTFDQFLNGVFFTSTEAIPSTSSVNFILIELGEVLHISSEKINRECADYIASSKDFLDVWYKFQSWQFNYKKSSCLLHMSSLILNWTDISHDFRCSLINNGYLFYYVMQLKTLESIRLFKVEDLVTYYVAIITNCVQESNFNVYVSTINWKGLLSPWLEGSSKNLQFQTRLLGCFVASSLNLNDLPILDMDSADLETLLRMLGSASTSTQLKASGFGFTFSATEILESLLHLFISPKNLQSLLSMEVMPTILSLLLNGHSQDKLLSCQLLWILVDESCFQWDQELQIKEVLTAMPEDNDESLQLFSKLLLSEPCFETNDFKDELQPLHLFFQQSTDQWYHICQSIGLSEDYQFVQSLSSLSVNKRVLFVLLLQKSAVNIFFNLLSSDPKALSHDFQCIKYSSSIEYPQTIWMKKMLNSCELITQIFLNASIADKDASFLLVVQFWRQIYEVSKVCIPSVLMIAVDECANMESIWHVFYELLSLLYKAEISGLGMKDISICLLRLMTILRDWSAVSKLLCSSLLKKGLIINHCGQLLNWTKMSHLKMVEYMVKANLRILLNCLHYSEFKVYIKAFDWLTLLEQLRNTAISAIQLATKILGFYLSSSNPELFMELSENDILQILDIAAKAAGSFYELNEFKFYSLDMIMCLQKFIEQDKSDNVLSITPASILPIFVTIFSNGTLEEKTEMYLFVWSFLYGRKYDLNEDYLQLFEDHREIEELKNITKCILVSYDCANKPEYLPTRDECDLLIKTTFKHCRYMECISWCMKKEGSSLSDSEDLQLKVIRAKALYYLYKSEQSKLRTFTEDEYYKAYQRCYDKTREVIGLLGVAHDKGGLDSEGSKLLVLSMMDYIHTTNKLNDCNRCYLCWKKLHATTNPEGMKESKGKSRHSKLVHSHTIPYSILVRFSQSVPAKRNLKVFRSSAEGTPMEQHKGKVYAPRQITRYMFCNSCEDILSAKGESWFVRDFFDKIYDSTDPLKPHQSQKIAYGKWLYHFCVGMIYRNLIWEENSFLNENELYELLLGCRDYILSSELCDNSPELYLLVTPIAGDEEDLKYGSINNVLSGSLEWYIGRHKLGNKSLKSEDAVLASFFLFHLGAVNILVKLSPSQGCSIDDCFKVNADSSQVYFIPEEINRRKGLPPGMWAHLLDEAKHTEMGNLETSASASIDLDSDKNPYPKSPEAVEMFGIVQGVKKQLSEAIAHGIQPTPCGSEKRFNFLPAGFEVRSEARPNSVSLPQGHLILLHHTFVHGTDKGETIFIVRDTAEDTCYLIWNNFNPGLQYSVAFHLSPSDASLTSVMTDKQSPIRAFQSPHFQATLDEAIMKFSGILSSILLKKGIFSLESLLLRAKGIGSFPSIDMKCKETACWFCFNRCDICFKVLGFDSIKTRVNKINVTVCNQECRWYLPGRKVQTSVVVASPGESPPPLYQDRCCPLFTSHKKYFHVYIEDTAEGLPLKGDIAVCFGDGSTQYPENKLYGVYFSRNIHKQVLFEFFLSDSFNLLCPLPYNKSNDLLISVIKTYEDDGCIGQYLKLACDEFKKPLSDDNGVSSHPGPDTLYTLTCTIADEMLSPTSISDKSITDKICRKLNCWNKDFVRLLYEDREIISSLIITAPNMVKTFLTFADSLFSEVGFKHKCLWSLNQTFALWSSTTPLMQQMLVEKGLMIGVLLELQAFTNCASSEDTIYLIQLALSILCNLLQVPSNVAYFMNTICDQIVSCFATSMDPKIRILSASILCYLEPNLTLDSHLQLKSKDVELMISLVQGSISEYNIIFHPAPLLRSLQMVMKTENNAKKFISQGIISIFKLIATCDSNIQREMIMSLWTLASYSPFIETVKSDVDLLRVVNSLKASDDHNLAAASLCALWDIDEDSRDGAGYIAFACGCYQCGMYERCAIECAKILQLSSNDSDIEKIRLLKGKALFHLCNKNIQKLPKIISRKDTKVTKILNVCIEYATEAVNLLGSAHDHECIDEEGSKCLDLCMMFLISSTNALNKCQRCLLCLSKSKSGKGLHSNGNVNKQHKGLQHSHIIPKAVLEAFSSGLIKTKSQRIFLFCGTETSSSQLKSPREATWFMLCSECEQLFGRFENQFINLFFKKIYDVSNPITPLESQEIDYGCWLYKFCISLFFRGVAILDIPCNDNVKRFKNSEKLYKIFVRCRKILLAPPDTQLLFPSVHILINPTLPTPEESQLYTTLHEVLVSPSILGLAAEKDSKKYFVGPSKANLFLAHMGIVNVVVDVEAIIPSESHLISHNGGLYHVPHDNHRNQFIPPDLKEIFYVSAQQIEVQKETISDKLRESHWAKGIVQSPPKDREQTFMVHPAQKKDLKLFQQEGVRPSQDLSKVKVVSFLPHGFKLMQISGILELPPEHRILFHCEPDRSLGYSNSFDKGITVFLAIGNGSKGYPADKPYAIYHKYDPGLQFNMAMFVSSTDLSVMTPINNGSRQQTAEMLFKNSHFQESIQLVLRTKLHQIGFSSFNSFLLHAQEKRMFKCQTKRRCWYCINRCDNCMASAAVGLTKKSNDATVKFCSEVCSKEFNANPMVLNLLPAEFRLTKDNGKFTAIPPAGHQMLQCVTDHFDEDEELLVATSTTRICVGNDSVEFPKDKVYILYETSTVLSQTLVAFFINDDFSIIPLTNPPQVFDAEVAMWFSNKIQPQVRSVLEAVSNQAGFSTFKTWCTAAVQGEESYFASRPFYEQY